MNIVFALVQLATYSTNLNNEPMLRLWVHCGLIVVFISLLYLLLLWQKLWSSQKRWHQRTWMVEQQGDYFANDAAQEVDEDDDNDSSDSSSQE